VTSQQPTEILFLSQEDVITAGGLDMAAAVSDLEDVFRLHAAGDYVLPEKIVLHWQDPATGELENHINTMPGYIGGRFDSAGLKTIASFPRNPFEHGLPRASALVVLNHTETGLPLAVMDGTLISAIRTGAATGVAARYLARPDVVRVGLIGAGVQNRTQLMALKVARSEIDVAMVFDRRQRRAEDFAAEMSHKLEVQVEAAADAESVVRQSDVLVTATTTTQPIVHQDWLPPGSFYAHIAGYECEYDVIRNADKVVVDDWNQVKHRLYSTVALMWRDGEFSDDDLYADLGEIASGQRPGREADDEVIIFSPIGMGIEDIAVASRIYRVAEEAGIGQRVVLWQNPVWS
jgi:2,3-diaminopropionate biosynthesis protein SbnB